MKISDLYSSKQMATVVCCKCGKILCSKYYLGKHLEICHQAESKIPEEKQAKEEKVGTRMRNHADRVFEGTKCLTCGKEFSTKYALKRHLRETRKCGKPPKKRARHFCSCGVESYSAKVLVKHKDKCKSYKIWTQFKGEIETLRRNLDIVKEENLDMEAVHQCELASIRDIGEDNARELRDAHEDNVRELQLEHEEEIEEILKDLTYIHGAVDALSNVAGKQVEVSKAKARIEALEKKHLRRQKRKQYEKNVVYLITTQDLKKRRTYIVGKAGNLTNRLSSYNKTDEHEVVSYKSCPTKEDMDILEKVYLRRLHGFRELANRDRFILPEDNEELFVDLLQASFEFICP